MKLFYSIGLGGSLCTGEIGLEKWHGRAKNTGANQHRANSDNANRHSSGATSAQTW